MSVLVTCTSDDRPENPANGDLLYETDTNKLIFYFDGWVTYGQSNTSTGGETPTILFTHGDTVSSITDFTSGAQTGDMFLDNTLGVEELNVFTNTTSSIFVFDNLNSNSLAKRFVSTEERRPKAQSIQQYITGGDQNITQLLSAGDITTTTSTPDLFYVYNTDLNQNHVLIFGKEVFTTDMEFESQTDIEFKSIQDTITQQLSSQHIDHSITSLSSVSNLDEVTGIHNPLNDGVFGVHTNKLSYNTSFNLTCSSDGTTNYSGRYIHAGNNFVENYNGAYSVDIWFMLLPSIEGHVTRQLMGYSSHQISCHVDDGGSYLKSTGTYFGSWTTAPGSLQLNTWHRMTNTRDDSGNGKVYLDGQLVSNYTQTGKIYVREFVGDSSTTYNDNYMHGYVFSIGTWRRELSLTEIDDLMNPVNTYKYSPYFWLFPSIEMHSESAHSSKCRDVLYIGTASTNMTEVRSDPTGRTINISTPENFIEHNIYNTSTPF